MATKILALPPYFCMWMEDGTAKAERIEDESEAHQKVLERSGVLIDSSGTVMMDFIG